MGARGSDGKTVRLFWYWTFSTDQNHQRKAMDDVRAEENPHLSGFVFGWYRFQPLPWLRLDAEISGLVLIGSGTVLGAEPSSHPSSQTVLVGRTLACFLLGVIPPNFCGSVSPLVRLQRLICLVGFIFPERLWAGCRGGGAGRWRRWRRWSSGALLASPLISSTHLLLSCRLC